MDLYREAVFYRLGSVFAARGPGVRQRGAGPKAPSQWFCGGFQR